MVASSAKGKERATEDDDFGEADDGWLQPGLYKGRAAADPVKEIEASRPCDEPGELTLAG